MVLWNSQGPTGRERAIESLIDREPHGNYYRAARVVVSSEREYRCYIPEDAESERIWREDTIPCQCQQQREYLLTPFYLF
jgi:hypothetical protein